MPRRRLDVKKAKEDVCAAVRAGNTMRTAGDYAGIDETTLYRWLRRDNQFSQAVTKAAADCDTRLVANIVKASATTWQAAAWLLQHHPRLRYLWRSLTDGDWRKLSIEQLCFLAGMGPGEGEGGIDSPGDALASSLERERD